MSRAYHQWEEEDEFSLPYEEVSGHTNPEERYRLYRLCTCSLCDGSRFVDDERCPECKGEGRTRENLVNCPTPESLGTALVQLAEDGEFSGEFEGCAHGCLDKLGKPGKKWLWKPWQPSPRNTSDAGRVLASARRKV